jgi:hypothetical protein
MSIREVKERFDGLELEVHQIKIAVDVLDDWTIDSRDSVATLIDTIQDRLEELQGILQSLRRDFATEVQQLEAGNRKRELDSP